MENKPIDKEIIDMLLKAQNGSNALNVIVFTEKESIEICKALKGILRIFQNKLSKA